jgi:hypothetical protein
MTSKSSLVRQNSESVQLSALTGECIQGFIDYVKTKGTTKKITKWQDTNIDTVVDNLIEVMVMKGYKKLSFPIINLMKLAIDKPKFTRTQMFEFISGFAGKKNIMVTGEARDELTISSSALTAATQAADISYKCRTYNTCPDSIKPSVMTSDEINLANRIKYTGASEQIKSGRKK